MKSLIRNGEKVKAIKHVHQEKGMSLTASKAYVEKLSVLEDDETIKDIIPLILESIWNKKKMRGGMNSFEDLSNPSLNQKNRSMITIGG